MTDYIIYQRKCDSRTFYRGKPRANGELPSYRCPRAFTASSQEELERRAIEYGWQKIGERDVCKKCFENARKDGL
jgi:hypothetical protein